MFFNSNALAFIVSLVCTGLIINFLIPKFTKKGIIGKLEMLYQWFALKIIRHFPVITTSPILKQELQILNIPEGNYSLISFGSGTGFSACSLKNKTMLALS